MLWVCCLSYDNTYLNSDRWTLKRCSSVLCCFNNEILTFKNVIVIYLSLGYCVTYEYAHCWHWQQLHMSTDLSNWWSLHNSGCTESQLLRLGRLLMTEIGVGSGRLSSKMSARAKNWCQRLSLGVRFLQRASVVRGGAERVMQLQVLMMLEGNQATYCRVFIIVSMQTIFAISGDYFVLTGMIVRLWARLWWFVLLPLLCSFLHSLFVCRRLVSSWNCKSILPFVHLQTIWSRQFVCWR